MGSSDHADVWVASLLAQQRPRRRYAPRPGVAKPKRRKHVQRGRLRSAVLDGDPDQHILRGSFGVLDEHVEITVVVEDAGVEQFVLEFLPTAAAVGLDELAVRVGRLRVLV